MNRHYKILITQGQGSTIATKKKTLKGALRWVKRHKGEGAFGIEYPNGKMHNWQTEQINLPFNKSTKKKFQFPELTPEMLAAGGAVLGDNVFITGELIKAIYSAIIKAYQDKTGE